MTPDIQLDDTAASVLGALQALFGDHGTVKPVHLNAPGLVSEFRPGVATDTDLGSVPKPALDLAFGVELGGVSSEGRRCALVFTHFSRLEAFYAENSSLCGTLVTGWHGAAVIWLRAAGRIPRTFAVDGIRWCSEGTVLVGCPKQPVETFLSLRGEIKAVDFSGIIWSEQQKGAIDQIFLETEVGPPFRTVARGRRVLNLGFWARYFTGMMSISYDPDRDVFVWGDAKVREPVLLTVDQTITEFMSLLQIASASFGAEFPHGEIRPARVRQLVERVKLLTTKPRVSDGEVLDSFLASEVVRAPGKVITSFEFRARYVRYCQNLGRIPCSELRFLRGLKAKLSSMGIEQRHDIACDGKPVRGYGGLTLRQELPTQGTDGSDGSDATDGAQDTSS